MTVQSILHRVQAALYRDCEDNMIQHGCWQHKPIRVRLARLAWLDIQSDPVVLKHVVANASTQVISVSVEGVPLVLDEHLPGTHFVLDY